jgi:hypothetical protein
VFIESASGFQSRALSTSHLCHATGSAHLVLNDNQYTLLSGYLTDPILIDVKTCTKTGWYMDILLNNHTSKLRTFANTNTGHQNGVIYRGILLNLNAR